MKATDASIKKVHGVLLARGKLGLHKALIYLKGKMKEVLSVPAPRKRVVGKRGKMKGVLYYRSTTKAVHNAPPRKLSGRLRSSIQVEMAPDGLSGRLGTNVKSPGGFPYPQHLEENGHAFVSVIVKNFGKPAQWIIANEIAGK